MAAPSRSTGIDRPMRKSCSASTLVSGSAPTNRLGPLQGAPDQDDGDDEDGGARALRAEPYGRPQDERQRRVEDGGEKTARDPPGAHFEGDRADDDERRRTGRRLRPFGPTAANPTTSGSRSARSGRPGRASGWAGRWRDTNAPRTAHNSSASPPPRIGTKAPPSADDGGTDAGGDQDVEASLAQVGEPGRVARETADRKRVEHRHHAIGRERHQHLAASAFRPRAPPPRAPERRPRCTATSAVPGRSSSAQNRTTFGGQNGAKILSDSVPMRNAISAPMK